MVTGTVPGMRTSTIALRGPYSLEEVALMGFGHRDDRSFDGVMRLAFCLDTDLEQQVGVEVRQAGDRLDLVVHGDGDLAAVTRQVARVVSADHDGAAYAEVCAGDAVLARVHAAAPGFRPANFHSAFEAAAWSVLSARRQRRQAIALRARLAEEHGARFELAGQVVHALPTPAALARLDRVPGLPDAALPRLHAVAEAASAGRLDVDRLTALGPDEAMAELQRLPGIGAVLQRARGGPGVWSHRRALDPGAAQPARRTQPLRARPRARRRRAGRDRGGVAAVPHVGHRGAARGRSPTRDTIRDKRRSVTARGHLASGRAHPPSPRPRSSSPPSRR